MKAAWPGRNTFIYKEHVLLGPDYHRGVLTFLLILGPAVLILVFPCGYFLSEKEEPGPMIIGCILTVLALGLLTYCATSNPGIIPKQNSTFARGPLGAPLLDSVSLNNPLKSRELPIRGFLLKLRYCETCTPHPGLLYRPPRASHCSICDVCVESFDHHCPWLGNCVGRRNYVWFLAFLATISTFIAFGIVICIAQVVEVMEDKGGEGAVRLVGTWIPLGVTIAGCWFAPALLFFHLYLCTTAQTTNECAKGHWQSYSYNPYHLPSLCSNWISSLCRKRPPYRWSFSTLPEPDDKPIIGFSPARLAVQRAERPRFTTEMSHFRLISTEIMASGVDLEPLREKNPVLISIA